MWWIPRRNNHSNRAACSKTSVVTIECDFDCGVIFIDNLRLEGVRTATACGGEEKNRPAKSGWLCAVVGDKTGEGNKSEMVSKGFLTDRPVTPNPWCRDKFPGNQLRTNPSIVRYQFITSGIFQLRNDRTARATLACINNLILLRLLYLSTICDKNVRFGVDKVNYPPIPIFCLQDSIGFEFGDAGVGNGGKNSVCQFPELLGRSRVSSTYSLRKYKDCR